MMQFSALFVLLLVSALIRKLKPQKKHILYKAQDFLKWSFIIQLFLSNLLELSLYASLQGQNPNFYDGINIISFILFLIATIYIIIWFIAIVKVVNNKKISGKEEVENEEFIKFKDKFGYLWDEIKISQLLSRNFHVANFLRKVLLSFFVVSAYYIPGLQISLVFCLYLLMAIYCLFSRPYIKKTLIFANLVTEWGMVILNFVFLIYYWGNFTPKTKS